MRQIFPPEILSRVVHSLAEDAEEDIQTLRTLAITSSVFLQPCRSVIFHHIKLDDYRNRIRLHLDSDRKTPGEKILNLVNSSPWVAKYVKKITIYDCFYTSWLANDLKVAEALNKLNLQQIKYFVLHRGFNLPWDLLAPEIKAVVVKICQSPTLVHLSLRCTPLSLLGVVRPTLESLEAMNTIVNRDEGIKPVPRSQSLSIRTLRIEHTRHLDGNIEWLTNSAKNDLRLDALEELRVHTSIEGDHSCVPKLLEVCKTSLKTFIFTPYVAIRDPHSHFFDIEGCTSLETLSLRVDATQPDLTGERNCLRWTSNFISRISKSNVTRIHLFLEWELSDAPGDIENPISLFHSSVYYWLRTLGTAACDTQKFPRIQMLDVEVKSRNPFEDDTLHIERFVKLSFKHIPRPDLVTVKVLPHTLDAALWH